MARNYRVVSGDSHLEIAPSRWTNRVPTKHRDHAPRLVELENGGHGVIVENRPLYVLGLAVTGKPFEEHQLSGVRYGDDGGPGTGSPEKRLKEQDVDGVDAEVMFTSAGNGGFWRGVGNDDAYRAIIHAYNEFLAEEYCAVDRDRLLAMPVMPSTGVNDAIAEMEYCKKAGLKGVALSTFPSGKGYPTAEDDRFWAAAVEMNMPLTVHIGFIGRGDGQVFQYEKSPSGLGFGTDPVKLLTRFGGGVAQNPIQLIFSGIFDRFPSIRIYWAETMIGWVPYFYEQLDDIYERCRHYALREYGLPPLKRRPSEYIKDHCIWGFLHDPWGVKIRHAVGLKNAMWGNDFPHSAGNWPHSLELLDEMFEGVSADEKDRLICRNAVEFFHLDDSRN
jgi:predicted TIM-barrel fold metal-dependent hydrolase